MLGIDGLIQRVRAIINEYVQGEDDFVTENTEILKELIIQAAQEVTSIAPNYYCTMSQENNSEVKQRPDGRYVILFSIPEGMVRPVQIASNSLIKPIHDFLPVEDPRYTAQYSSIPGIGAGRFRPVAFVRGGEDAQIEAHSASDNTANGTLYYVAKPTLDEEGNNLNVNSVLEPAIALKAAQLALEAERSESAGVVNEHYKEAIQSWT